MPNTHTHTHTQETKTNQKHSAALSKLTVMNSSSLFSDAAIFLPFFNGSSYLEVPPPSSLLQGPLAPGHHTAPGAASSSGSSAYPAPSIKTAAVTLSLAVKTGATQGSLLYSEYTPRAPSLPDRKSVV